MGRLGTAAIAVACGIAGACLYLAVMLGTPSGLIFVYMTQLPLFIAGLWLGAGAAALAGLTGALVLLAASDLLGAAVFAGLNAVPVALLVRQALLARQDTDGTVAWYPLGLLTAWLTGFALAGIAAAILFLGGPDGLQSALKGVIGEVLDRLSRRPVPNRDQVAELVAMVIPGIVAASWMMMLVATVPFCLAGLAVLHAAARRLTHPVMALISFYAVAALFGWPFLAVAILGLLESWLGLRHRLASPGSWNNG